MPVVPGEVSGFHLLQNNKLKLSGGVMVRVWFASVRINEVPVLVMFVEEWIFPPVAQKRFRHSEFLVRKFL
jgi:hypothetical protein